jgi:SAM-dependent methyltransferase
MGSDVIDDLSGYYRSLMLLHLCRSGVLVHLKSRLTSAELAAASGLQHAPLKACLDFMCETSDLVRRDRKRQYYSVLTKAEIMEVCFLAEKFIGAYGKCILQLPALVNGIDAQDVCHPDLNALSSAYEYMAETPRSLVVAMIAGSRIRRLLDLGCGTGSLLVQLAEVKPSFSGVGVDSSRAMCKSARRHANKHGLGSRIRIFCQDATEVSQLPDADALHAASLINELFSQGSGGVIRFLKQLRDRFEGRDFWVVDYYGTLGLGSRAPKEGALHGQLHDVVQLLSGQGVPPATLREWRSIYRQAGCHLIEAHDLKGDRIRWFVHRVRL